MTDRPKGRIQLTGLSDDELTLIRVAANLSRKTIRDYVLEQARATVDDVQKALNATADHK